MTNEGLFEIRTGEPPKTLRPARDDAALLRGFLLNEKPELTPGPYAY
jgi:hypothetical protein